MKGANRSFSMPSACLTRYVVDLLFFLPMGRHSDVISPANSPAHHSLHQSVSAGNLHVPERRAHLTVGSENLISSSSVY